MLLSAIGGMAFFIGSCDKGTGDEGSIGTITGTVLDTEENPIAGVSVTAKDLDVTAETGTDGSYVLENVPVSSILLTLLQRSTRLQTLLSLQAGLMRTDMLSPTS